MALVEVRRLVGEMCPPLDNLLCAQLLDEFVSAERRFIQRDWGPAELDGGQFCEVLARIFYHQDSGTLSQTKEFGDCLSYLENDKVPHAIIPRHNALHVARTMRTVYKFRSQRGAVHISPTYSPNHMDSKFIIECVRWAMNETLRIFWRGDREAVARAIRELLQFDVPCIGTFQDVLLVQRTDLSAEEELLVLLHYAGEQGFTRTELGRSAQHPAPSITRAIQKLCSPTHRQAVLVAGTRYRLTDLGSRRIREQLATKLLLQ